MKTARIAEEISFRQAIDGSDDATLRQYLAEIQRIAQAHSGQTVKDPGCPWGREPPGYIALNK